MLYKGINEWRMVFRNVLNYSYVLVVEAKYPRLFSGGGPEFTHLQNIWRKSYFIFLKLSYKSQQKRRESSFSVSPTFIAFT